MEALYKQDAVGDSTVVSLYHPSEYTLLAQYTLPGNAYVLFGGGSWLREDYYAGGSQCFFGTTLDNLTHTLTLSAGDSVVSITKVGTTWALALGSGNVLTSTDLVSFSSHTPSPTRDLIFAAGSVWFGQNTSTNAWQYTTDFTAWTTLGIPSGYDRPPSAFAEIFITYYNGAWYELLRSSTDGSGAFLAKYTSLSGAPSVSTVVATGTTFASWYVSSDTSGAYAVIGGGGEALLPIYYRYGPDLGSSETIAGSDCSVFSARLLSSRLYVDAINSYVRGSVSLSSFPPAYVDLGTISGVCEFVGFTAWWRDKTGCSES